MRNLGQIASHLWGVALGNQSLGNPLASNRRGMTRGLGTLMVSVAVLPFLAPGPAKAADPLFAQSNVGETLMQTEAELSTPLPLDGVYLYGQSSDPNQMGAAYMVFEARNGVTVGAFYMPSSSFDCFYGSVQSTEMALTVVDSYSREAFPYAVAVDRTNQVAAANGGSTTLDLVLEGFHQLAELSEGDREILSVCQADLQDQVW